MGRPVLMNPPVVMPPIMPVFTVCSLCCMEERVEREGSEGEREAFRMWSEETVS